MKTIFLVVLVFNFSALAQYRYELTQTPKPFDVSYEVEKCESNYCFGDLKVRLRKNGAAFQEISLQTDFGVNANQKKLNRVGYRDQHIVNFADVNFDGVADLSIQNGRDSGYGGASYNIYTCSPRTGKFRYHSKLSSLAGGPYLGMFEVDRKKKLLRTYSKSGCCMHETEEYRFISGRVKKVFSEFEDLTAMDGKRAKITTRRLVGGKWKQTVRYAKRDQL